MQLRRPHGAGDRLITLATLTAYALPTFGVALGLIALFSYRLHLLPPSHMYSLEGELATVQARTPVKIRPLVAAAIAAAVAVLLGALWLGGSVLRASFVLRTAGLIAITPILVLAAYTFLRDDELEPYRGLALAIRTAICTVRGLPLLASRSLRTTSSADWYLGWTCLDSELWRRSSQVQRGPRDF